MTMRGCVIKVLRASVGVVLLVWFLWFLVGGALLLLAEQQPIGERTSTTKELELDVYKIMGYERGAFHREFKLHFVSKRRIPNGPDPIHNRREWKLRHPPTRA